MSFTPESSRKAVEARAAKRAARKSGDALLQDAQAARDRDFKEGSTMDMEEHLHSLKDQVQDAAEVKKSSGDLTGAARTADAFMKLTAALQNLEKRILAVESSPSKQLTRPDPIMKCPTCKQVTKLANGRGVCNGDHKLMFIRPKNRDYWPAFQGVTINGATYIDRAVVPACLVDDIAALVGRWEHGESKLKTKEGRVFNDVDFRSGVSQGRASLI